jgi:hypothetical protein
MKPKGPTAEVALMIRQLNCHVQAVPPTPHSTAESHLSHFGDGFGGFSATISPTNQTTKKVFGPLPSSRTHRGRPSTLILRLLYFYRLSYFLPLSFNQV